MPISPAGDPTRTLSDVLIELSKALESIDTTGHQLHDALREVMDPGERNMANAVEAPPKPLPMAPMVEQTEGLLTFAYGINARLIFILNKLALGRSET